MIVNLLDNASKSIGGDGAIWIRLSRTEETVRLSVRDDGCGMSEEVKRRACEPFFSTRDAGDGAGLGLALVASIVASHGGRLEIESEEGNGTEVAFRVPIASTKPAPNPSVDRAPDAC